MRKSYHSEQEFRDARIVSVAVGLSLHCILVLGLFFLQQNETTSAAVEEFLFGSSGGGGGEGKNEKVTDFGPQSSSQNNSTEEWVFSHQFTLIDINVISESPVATPVLKKEKITAPKKSGRKKQESIIAENLPIGRVRKGVGPGSGGGIGAGKGFAIDWGGNGSRRLLSGRLPEYPKGTDKQLAVVLQFYVLPDGSVGRIIPLRKSDELLERAAISALQTWRFDPLPSQLEQKSQSGTITFHFKLE